jgi:hypothetical protein
MAPEIALDELLTLRGNAIVLDPMSGSGMVLAQAAKLGLQAHGVDLDPLAKLISSVGATPVSVLSVTRALGLLLMRCRADHAAGREVSLVWIDRDPETARFIEFWFARQQQEHLRLLSHHLMVEPVSRNQATLNLLKVAVSRLIVTKEPKASLARDTAHSRPHRWITKNDFDVFGALEDSVRHVLSVLEQTAPIVPAKTYLGDARRLSRIADRSIDSVVTSPPYLNAIDYMRGHKLSLVWWGHNISQLTRIRLSAIGTEKARETSASQGFKRLSKIYGWEDLPAKSQAVLLQYYFDLSAQLIETARVLKPSGKATYVVGDSNVRGIYVPNHQLLISAAKQAGLRLIASNEREIPNHKRYLPTPKSNQGALGGRMRTEHILSFAHS